MIKKIIVGSSNFGKYSSHSIKLLEEKGYKLIINRNSKPFNGLELLKLVKDKDVIGSLAGLEVYTKDILENSNIKVISRLGSGLTNIDLKTAKQLNIKIYSTPTAPVNSVAELTVSMMISLMRNTITLNNDLKKGNWNKLFGNNLFNKNILIIGYGNIGKKVKKILEVFDVNVLIYDPYLNKGNNDLITYLKIADVITIHVNTEEQILGKPEIETMKNNAIILNASRGKNICEKSLIDHLRKNKDIKVWLDVFKDEPYEGKLLSFNNVFVTPHIASLTYETRLMIEKEAINNLMKTI